jgi:hypothetical protein
VAAILDERFMVGIRGVLDDTLRLAQLLNQPVLTEENQRERDAIIQRINLRLNLESDHLNYYNERREEGCRIQESNNRSIAELGNEMRGLAEIERDLLLRMRGVLPREIFPSIQE